jgi:dihydroflavonol-4-reductase
MKIAYVTGATGCVGRNLVRELLSTGEWKVVVLHRKSSKIDTLKEYNLTFKEVDLYNIESIRESIPFGIDAVFHVAGNVSHWYFDRKIQWKDNVLVTKNLVQIALEKKVKRFIFTSTGATELKPVANREEANKIKSSYIRTKALAEMEVYDGIRKGLDAVILKPAIIVGEYDYHNYSKVFKYLKNNKMKMSFPGSTYFCHAKNIAKAHIAAFEKGRCCENYLLGDVSASWLEFFTKIANVIGVKPPKRKTPFIILYIISYAFFVVSCFTKKRPILTPDIVRFLSAKHRKLSYKESYKSSMELGYVSSTLDEMIKDCYNWMIREKML